MRATHFEKGSFVEFADSQLRAQTSALALDETRPRGKRRRGRWGTRVVSNGAPLSGLSTDGGTAPNGRRVRALCSNIQARPLRLCSQTAVSVGAGVVRGAQRTQEAATTQRTVRTVLAETRRIQRAAW